MQEKQCHNDRFKKKNLNKNRNFLVMIYIIKPFSAAILSLFVLYIVFAIEFLWFTHFELQLELATRLVTLVSFTLILLIRIKNSLTSDSTLIVLLNQVITSKITLKF